uniref:Uncharacterized protein n=1 Tax=Oncorhynchus tshawytscha TaxID=74940 RepID=A0AAZ3SCT7_ONCTS
MQCPITAGPLGLVSSTLTRLEATSPPTMRGASERHSWRDPREGPGALRVAATNPPPVHLQPADGHHPNESQHAAPCETTRWTTQLNGGERVTEGLLPQPRFEPSPTSHPSLTEPALRANPYPEVRSFLPTCLTYIVITCQRLFTLETCCGYSKGILPGVRFTPSPPDFQEPGRAHRMPPKQQRFPGLGPLPRGKPIPGLPPASPGSAALPHWMPRGARLHQSMDILKVV